MHTRFGSMLLWIAAGCPAEDADDTSTNGDGSTTSASTSSSTTTLGPTVSSSTTDDPTASGSLTTIGDTTAGTTDMTEGTTGATSETGPESESTGSGAEACMAGCQVEVDCGPCAGGMPWKSVEACVDWCTANLEEAGLFSFACRSAWRGVHACVGALDCDGFDAWCAKDPPFAYVCYRADVEQSFACEGQ